MAKPPPVEEMSMEQLKEVAAKYREFAQRKPLPPAWAERLAEVEKRIAELAIKERMQKIETETSKPGFPWGDT